MRDCSGETKGKHAVQVQGSTLNFFLASGAFFIINTHPTPHLSCPIRGAKKKNTENTCRLLSFSLTTKWWWWYPVGLFCFASFVTGRDAKLFSWTVPRRNTLTRLFIQRFYRERFNSLAYYGFQRYFWATIMVTLFPPSELNHSFRKYPYMTYIVACEPISVLEF